MLLIRSCDTPSAKEGGGGGGGELKGAGKFDILFSYSLDNTWWVLTDKLQSNSKSVTLSGLVLVLPGKRFFGPKRKELGLFSEIAADNRISNKAMTCLVCYTAVFSGEERCVTTLKTAV